MKALADADLSPLRRQGWEALDTTFDLSYKSHWDMWHAIREFVQNALDEHDDQGIAAPVFLGRRDGALVIEDQGRGLGAQALLMRETKRGAGDLRGQFGEGLKFACIVTLRQGYDVEIASPQFVIRPIVRVRTIAGESLQLVSFLYKDIPGTSRGTRITVRGYSGPDYSDRFWPFLMMKSTRSNSDLLTWGVSQTLGRFNRNLSITTVVSNRLYVGDIYVRDLGLGFGTGGKGSPYSYNLWTVLLNPDRDAEVWASRLTKLISWVWVFSDAADIKDLLLQLQRSEGFEGAMDWSYHQVAGVDPERVPQWQRAWNEVYGTKGVLWTSDAWARYAESYGYVVVHMPASFRVYLADVISPDEQAVKARVGNTGAWRKEIADKDLSPSETSIISDARSLTRDIVKEIGGRKAPELVIAEFSVDPATNERVLGLYEAEYLKISLSRDILHNAERALRVLLHELGHWFSGAGDLTAEHTDSVAKVALYALQSARKQMGLRVSSLAPVAEVATSPGQKRPSELSWIELAAMARQAGISDVDHYSKAVLRRMLNLS